MKIKVNKLQLETLLCIAKYSSHQATLDADEWHQQYMAGENMNNFQKFELLAQAETAADLSIKLERKLNSAQKNFTLKLKISEALIFYRTYLNVRDWNNDLHHAIMIGIIEQIDKQLV